MRKMRQVIGYAAINYLKTKVTQPNPPLSPSTAAYADRLETPILGQLAYSETACQNEANEIPGHQQYHGLMDFSVAVFHFEEK